MFLRLIYLIILATLVACKKKESSPPPCSSRSWEVTAWEANPTKDLQNLRTFIAGDTGYEWKDDNNNSVEAGIYEYEPEQQVLVFTPQTNSFITGNNRTYRCQGFLKDSDLRIIYQSADTLVQIDLKRKCF
jgi:hypothetical protein